MDIRNLDRAVLLNKELKELQLVKQQLEGNAGCSWIRIYKEVGDGFVDLKSNSVNHSLSEAVNKRILAIQDIIEKL